MADIKLNSFSPTIPMIYAYTTPEIARHNGWTKIGYTEQEVTKRLNQQTHTADAEYKLEWKGNATYDDGSGETFKDTAFHAYLTKKGVERKPRTEWFRITPDPAHIEFTNFRMNRGVVDEHEAIPYDLRQEQETAVEKAEDYAKTHPHGEFLWNAKPRFGKTLSAYDLCKQLGAVNVLIVTNRPAIANSWYDDYCKFLGPESGYLFVSTVDALAGKKNVLSRDEFTKYIASAAMKGDATEYKCIEFVSLQDLKGGVDFGGSHPKLQHIKEIHWDMLIVDEAHEGVDTNKTDVAFDHVARNFTLHLSGTPFKALANEKFPQDAIFNWTYTDEQNAKKGWNDPDASNPYEDMPKLNLYTYQMSEIIKDKLKKGIEIEGNTEEYAFDLNEFFSTDEMGRFKYNDSVDEFLDALTTQEKYPFSTPELRDELKHTFWLLNRVASATTLKKKLESHPVFKDYKIILAAGNGRVDDDDANMSSFEAVKNAIKNYDKTITLSVGQLTTGVTFPEWTGVLMLSNMSSPALYMQSAFRAQNPCLSCVNGHYFRKKNAYVFDFDPARSLTIFEEFANDLTSDTANGHGNMDARKQHVRTLLNFLPVIGEDDSGRMVELDAEQILSIPRKIRSLEVVKRGFMSNFLFQNISAVFGAPQAVQDILNAMPAVKDTKNPLPSNMPTKEDLSLDENGNVKIPEEEIKDIADDLFGDKIYGDTATDLQDVIDSVQLVNSNAGPTEEDKMLDKLTAVFVDTIKRPLVDTAKEKYADQLAPMQQKKVERIIETDCGSQLNKKIGDYKINRNKLDMEHQQKVDELVTKGASDDEINQIHEEYVQKKVEAVQDLKKNLRETAKEVIETAGKSIVEAVETTAREKKAAVIEDSVRDHLRGFSRTIPSFLMAYGNEEVALATFDTIIPPEVFKDVTSITLDQFRFLRDGGDYQDEDGSTKHFDGHLFDPVVFDDSVKVFMEKRRTLADYFNEDNKEDIFDYIPPQKTNQIFTPKWVVNKMVDELEEENPGCFDDPTKTFADLYMKSGLYITEIVKRLYNSDGLKQAYPDDKERIRHILNEQVYGCAPTEIIYKIATNYILGFDEELKNETKNFVMADTAELAKEGKLAEFVNKTFGCSE
jgi:hypothetical protein